MNDDWLETGADRIGTGDNSVQFILQQGDRAKHYPPASTSPIVRVENVGFKFAGPGVVESQNVHCKRLSIFHVTVNTNQKPKGEGEESLQTKLYRACESLRDPHSEFDQNQFKWIMRPNLQRMVKIMPQGTAMGHSWDSHVVNVHVMYGVEVGKDPKWGGRVHVHMEIKIYHNTWVQIDKQNMQYYFNDWFASNTQFNVKNVYVHIQHIRGGPSFYVERYVGKGAPGPGFTLADQNDAFINPGVQARSTRADSRGTVDQRSDHHTFTQVRF